MDIDISMLMDTSQDFEPHPDGVVRWVASQSPNPALQALMKEAEREKRTRPSTPVHEPMSWTYPLSSTASSTSLSTSVGPPWHSSGHNSADASYPLPLSGSTSSASSSSLAPRGSEPSMSRRTKPLSAAQRKPLASSTSSAKQPLPSLMSSITQPLASSTSSLNHPLWDPARPRSSSHSTALSNPSASTTKYIPQEEEPEAMAFVELLKDVSRQLDENSEKKQRLAARARGKERERSLGRSGIDNRTGLDTNNVSARPLIKTSSASAICPVGSSMRALERPSSTSVSAFKHEPRGRVLAKTASLGAPGVDLVSGKSTPTSLPSLNLNCNLNFAPARTSNTRNMHPTAARKTSTPEPTSGGGDGVMQDLDVIDLTETDTEWERPISGPMSQANTTTYMQVDVDDDDDMYSDTGMDMSFFRAEPPPQTRVAAPKPKPHPPQPNTASRPPAPTQRTRAAPPPLGMRRAPQLQSSQYSSSQRSKGMTVPLFKPPLLTNGGGATNKSGSGTKPTTTTSSKQPPRGGATKVAVAKTAVRGSQDADSSFDVSFDVDADALEEAMKAYD